MIEPGVRGLPDFEAPPVVETVLSVQFEKLAAMRGVHFGLFWRRMAGRFPKTEERPALDPVVERFPQPAARGVRIQFEAQETLTLPRLWLLNEAGTEMIQLQNDRFIKNWRKVGNEDEYPHYEPVIKPAFQRDFDEFHSFVAEEKLGHVKVNQCEVTYVNHIVSGGGWEKLEEIEKIFVFCKQPPAQPFPGRAEDFSYHARFPISTRDAQPIGRLHVDISPAWSTPDGRPMYVMNLTARGQCGPGFEFFDIAREWIVRSFENLTTPEMHAIWRKK